MLGHSPLSALPLSTLPTGVAAPAIQIVVGPKWLEQFINWLPPEPLPQYAPKLAPLSLLYGDEPPKFPKKWLEQWLDWLPGDPAAQGPVHSGIIPTLVFGDQPPAARAKWLEQTTAWQVEEVKAQGFQKNAAWNLLVGVQPFSQAWLAQVLAGWLPPEMLPPVAARIVPLTFTYGDQPPRFSAKWIEQNIGWLPGDPAAQGFQKNAAWNALIVSIQPFSRAWFAQVLSGWLPNDPLPQYGPRIVPLTFIYGDQPPNQRANEWLWRWPDDIAGAQGFAKNAAWNVLVQLVPPYLRYPMPLIAAWDALPDVLQAVRKITPLTLTYGDQPQKFSANRLEQLIDWLPVEPLPQGFARGTAWSVIIRVPYSRLPMNLISSWDIEDIRAQGLAHGTAWSAIILPPPPYVRYPMGLIGSWEIVPPYIIRAPGVTSSGIITAVEAEWLIRARRRGRR